MKDRPVVFLEASTARAAIVAAVQEAVAPLLARIEALESLPLTVARKNRPDVVTTLLTAVSNNFGSDPFSARDLQEHPDVRPLLEGRSVIAIGLLLTSLIDKPAGGRVLRLDETRDGNTNLYYVEGTSGG